MRHIVSDIPVEGVSHDFALPVEIKNDLQKETAYVTIKVRRLVDRFFLKEAQVCQRCLCAAVA